jgi:hypothetical protein
MSFIVEKHPIPKDLQAFMTTFAGKNPYGLPNWRLVVASDVWVREAGVYRDWDENLSVAERGGFNFQQSEEAAMVQIAGKDFEELGEQPQWEALRHGNRPIRTVTEVRDNPRYPNILGWILELWFPAHKYGSPEQWYAYKAVDGVTSMLGEYPHQGDYEMIYGPFKKTPTASQLQLWLSKYIYDRQHLRTTGTPEQRALEYVERYEADQQKQWMKRRAEYQAEMMDIWKPIATSGSGEMNRFRQQLARQAGQTSHVTTMPAL